MVDLGTKNVLGIRIAAMDYEAAVERIIAAAQQRRAMAVSALAVHGLMTGVLDSEHKYRLNSFDLLLPDGQPVRWALNLIHRAGLQDRVYGPNLTLKVCARAARESIPVYFYGSSPEVLAGVERNLNSRFPGLPIAGLEPSKFRRLTPGEKCELSRRIAQSGARIVFVGLGCPRQEVWAYEFRELLPLPVLAVGAAFPFIAGTLPQAPPWLQDHGLEWLFRLCAEPRRLWRRYLSLNPAYAVLLALQAVGICRFRTEGRKPSQELLYG